MFGDAADAAFLRTCGKPIAAAQRMSPDQSFAGDIPAGTETAFSPLTAQTGMSRTNQPFGFFTLLTQHHFVSWASLLLLRGTNPSSGHSDIASIFVSTAGRCCLRKSRNASTAGSIPRFDGMRRLICGVPAVQSGKARTSVPASTSGLQT